MVYIGRPKNWARLWAGIFSDFENLLLLFSQLEDIGCSFVEFAACCIEQKITTILNCSVRGGREKYVHYEAMCNIIFNCAKSFWLHPIDEEDTNVENSDVYAKMRSKRKLGGFFLLYLMYMKQPNKNRCKISMDIGNLEEFFKWKKGVAGTSYEEEVEGILECLHAQNAFSYCLLSEYFGIAALERKVLESSHDPKIPLILKRQNIRDELAMAPILVNVQKEFINCCNAKLKCFNRMELFCDYNPHHNHKDSRLPIPNEYMQSRTIQMLRENQGSEELTTALELIKEETDTPIITLPNLIGDPLENLIMISEFKNRIRRGLTKLRRLDKYGKYVVINPYLSESGIFGRHMGLYSQERERTHKRSSNIKSENLWAYVRGEKFGSASRNS